MPDEEREAWTKKNLAIRIAGPHVIESIEKHGWNATLHNVVVCCSKGAGDEYLNEFLTVMPTIACLRDFFKKMPTYEVDPETFEYLMKTGSFI